MQVRAKETGFIGGRRVRPGDVFAWDPETPLARWVETLDPSGEVVPPRKRKPNGERADVVE